MSATDSLLQARDLSYYTPNELVAIVQARGQYSAQALEELRARALHAPYPFKRKGTM